MTTTKTTKRHKAAMALALCAALAAANPATAFNGNTETAAGNDRGIADTTRTHRIDEVVVTGTNNATRRNLLPYTVSTVSNAQIEATGQSQLLSALSGRVPSLFVAERNIFGFGISNGSSGGIKIRGVGGEPTNSVLMMVDGQPQFAGIYSHHVADAYETEYVDHVEVLRGPGSVLYGSNAMGGVINVITKNAGRDGVHTTLSSQYGSYNTWRSTLTNTVRTGRFSSLVSIGYDRTDGTEKDFDFDQKSLYAKVGYDFSDHWKARADYSLMNFKGNDPIYPRLSNPNSKAIYHQNVTRGEASLSLTNHYGNRLDGSLRTYYSYGNHYVDDPNHFHSLDDRFGIVAYENFRPWRGAAATVGFDFDTYRGDISISGGHHYGDGSRQALMQTMKGKSITEFSPYVTLAQRLFGDILTLNAGLRMANSDRFDTQWVPQGGFTVRPAEGWMLKASVAKGYRNPSFREMYLYMTANPDLQSEEMTNYEVTLGKDFSRYFAIDVTGYFSEGGNMIQTVRQKNVNTGSFRNKGIEVTASSSPTDRLTLNATYSHLHTSLDGLTGAPRNQWYLGAAWQPMASLHVDADVRHVNGLYVDEDMTHEHFTLINLKLTYNATRWMDIFATIDNLANTRYTINSGYEMPGLTAMGGFKLHF